MTLILQIRLERLERRIHQVNCNGGEGYAEYRGRFDGVKWLTAHWRHLIWESHVSVLTKEGIAAALRPVCNGNPLNLWVFGSD